MTAFKPRPQVLKGEEAEAAVIRMLAKGQGIEARPGESTLGVAIRLCSHILEQTEAVLSLAEDARLRLKSANARLEAEGQPLTRRDVVALIESSRGFSPGRNGNGHN